MTSESARASADATPAAETEATGPDPADYCAWWVIAGGYASKNSNHVHIPKAILNCGGNDPNEEPDAETLCYCDSRKGSEWTTKSHAVLPPGYRAVCSKCQSRLAEVVVDE